MKRALLAALGLAAMIAAGSSLLLSLPAGFPDGYVSPWDQATGVWATVLVYALLVVGLFTLVAAAMSKPGRATVGAVLCILIGVSVWLLDGCPRMNWCSTAIAQTTGILPDDGQGG